MERQHQTLIRGLLDNELFLEALAEAVQPEIDDLTKKMRTCVRDGNLIAAADAGGQLTGIERIVPLLRRLTAEK